MDIKTNTKPISFKQQNRIDTINDLNIVSSNYKSEEGLGSLSSSDIKGNFAQERKGEQITMGFTGILELQEFEILHSETEITKSEEKQKVILSFNELLEKLKDYRVFLPKITRMSRYECIGSVIDGCIFTEKNNTDYYNLAEIVGLSRIEGGTSISLYDLFNENHYIIAVAPDNGTNVLHDSYDSSDKMQFYINQLHEPVINLIKNFKDSLYEIFKNSMNENIKIAIDEAYNSVTAFVQTDNTPYTSEVNPNQTAEYYSKVGTNFGFYYDKITDNHMFTTNEQRCHRQWLNAKFIKKQLDDNIIGYVGLHAKGKNETSAVGINYTTLLKSFLTCFAEKYEKLTFISCCSNYKHCINSEGMSIRTVEPVGKFDKQWVKTVDGKPRILGHTVNNGFSLEIEIPAQIREKTKEEVNADKLENIMNMVSTIEDIKLTDDDTGLNILNNVIDRNLMHTLK